MAQLLFGYIPVGTEFFLDDAEVPTCRGRLLCKKVTPTSYMTRTLHIVEDVPKTQIVWPVSMLN